MAALVLCAGSCKKEKEDTNTKKLTRIHGLTVDGTDWNYLTYHWTDNLLDSIGFFYMRDSDGYHAEHFTYENGRVVSAVWDNYTITYTYNGDKIAKIIAVLHSDTYSYSRKTYTYDYQGDKISRETLITDVLYTNGARLYREEYLDYTWEGDNVVKKEFSKMEDGVTTPVTFIEYYTFDNNHNPFNNIPLDFVSKYFFFPPLNGATQCGSHNILSYTRVDYDNDVADTTVTINNTYTYDADGYPTTIKCEYLYDSNKTIYNFAYEYQK